MQARYQYGNLTLRKRKKGPKVWQFRWMENGKLKSVLIGTVEKLPTHADAERAVEHLRMQDQRSKSAGAVSPCNGRGFDRPLHGRGDVRKCSGRYGERLPWHSPKLD